MKRLVVPMTLLLAVGVAAGPASAARRPVRKPVPPPIPACPVFTDPAKDDANADLQDKGAPMNGEDPALDVVGTKLVSDGKMLTITITMAKQGQPQWADGAAYKAGFTLSGKVVQLMGRTGRSQPVMENAYAQKGIYVDGTYVTGTKGQVTQVVDAGKNTVTVSASLTDIGAAAGTKAAGVVKGLATHIDGTFTQLFEPYDDAASTGTLRLEGCRA